MPEAAEGVVLPERGVEEIIPEASVETESNGTRIVQSRFPTGMPADVARDGGVTGSHQSLSADDESGPLWLNVTPD